MTITDETIQTLKALDIEQVAERLGMEVRRHVTLCPSHTDHTPSLHFHRARNNCRCFACGWGADTIGLVMKVLGVGFTEACRWLGAEERCAPVIETPKPPPRPERPLDLSYLQRLMATPVLTPEAQHFLYEERRLDPRVVRWLGISSTSHDLPCRTGGGPFFNAHSLLFPYKDQQGNLLSVQSRSLLTAKERPENVPRFRFPAGGRIGVFGLQVLPRLHAGDELYIAEGVTDCMAMLSSGRKAIAIPSASGLKDDMVLHFDSMPHGVSLHMYPDRDAPGDSLYHQLEAMANTIGRRMVRHSLPTGCKDFADYFCKIAIGR